MQRVAEDVLRSAILHQIAQIHNAHRVGDVLHHGQIVADEQVRQVVLLLDLLEQVDDLGLNGHVQRGHRLIADDEFRIQRQRPGNADTLPLTAGELVGIAVLVEGLQAAVVHDPVDIVVKFLFRHQIVLAHRLADDLTHRHSWGQRGKRILKNDLHFGTHSAHLLRRQIIDLLSVEQHLAGGFFVIQTQDGSAGGGLAAAGLSYEAHCGTALEVERHTIHGLDVANGLGYHTALDGKILLQMIDLQDILRVIFHRGEIVINDERAFPDLFGVLLFLGKLVGILLLSLLQLLENLIIVLPCFPKRHLIPPPFRCPHRLFPAPPAPPDRAACRHSSGSRTPCAWGKC